MRLVGQYHRSMSVTKFVQFPLLIILSSLFLGAVPTIAWPLHDPVLEWIGIMNDTALTAGTNPLATSRVVALVSASVYDAVNGIEPRYQPFFVKPDGPHSASQRAAAIQAAYAILIDLYPAQTFPNEAANLAAHRTASLIALAEHEKAESINAGIAWGQTVADAIWAWRLTDGNAPPPPPFVGVLGIEDKPEAIGVWRPTPKANGYGAGPQFATMTPWVLTRPSLFRLPPPLALDSPEFAKELAEITKMGIQSDSPHTADQSDLALFWAGNTPLYWDRIAVQLATKASLSLTYNTRLFALLNVTMADAAIACWDSKYRYVLWRPITAIRTGVGTQPADPTWTPWLDDLTGTPAHPEYPSGHSTVSGSAAAVLAAAFGENTPFTANTNTLLEGNVTHQTERVLENLKAILTHAGLTLSHVVKTTVFLKDMNDFEAMNEVYAKYFAVAAPAGTTVQATGLPKDALVEIELVAVL